MAYDMVKMRINFCNLSKTIEGTWVSPTSKEEYCAFKSVGNISTPFGFEGILDFLPPYNFWKECSIDVVLKLLDIEKRYTYEQVMRAVQEAYVLSVMES